MYSSIFQSPSFSRRRARAQSSNDGFNEAFRRRSVGKLTVSNYLLLLLSMLMWFLVLFFSLKQLTRISFFDIGEGREEFVLLIETE